MKWMLIVLAFGAPVKTGLTFPSLDECLQYEDRMRAEYTKQYKKHLELAQKTLPADEVATVRGLARERVTKGICIPHA